MNINFLTMDLVASYAKACCDLHDYLELLRQDYGLLVVPSRGASPFVNGAYTFAHQLRANKYEDFDPAPLITHIPELYLPFTADIESGFPISSKEIRGYWSRVLAAILRGDESDTSLKFYRYLLALADIPTAQPSNPRLRNGRFIFLDTVVSGQAINDIFDAFEANGLTDCHYVLIIDQQGLRLKPEYHRKIGHEGFTKIDSHLRQEHFY